MSNCENKHKCKNVGCRQSFKWPMQLSRHKIVCKFEKFVKKKNYESINGSFVCSKCSKTFKHQSNMTRHASNCSEKIVKEYSCDKCPKTFRYKCRLIQHTKVHQKEELKVCSNCDKRFQRIDHFLKHKEVCSKTDMLSVPSFVSPYDDQVESFGAPVQNDIPDLYDAVVPDVDIIARPEIDNPVVPEMTFEDDYVAFPDDVPELIDEDEDEEQEAELLNVTNVTNNDKKRNLEKIIRSISSPKKPSKKQNDEKYQAMISDALISHLKDLNSRKKYLQFHETLNTLFGASIIHDTDFLRWLAKKLQLKPHRLISNINKWQQNGLQELRGRNQLDPETQQAIYDTWIENCIVSTAASNGRNVVQISKRKYLEKYSTINNHDIVINEVKNKRGRTNMTSNRMIITCTVRKLMTKLEDKGFKTSLGYVLNLKPFFVTYPSDKEISLCLCKLCLNVKFLFEGLKSQAKKDGEDLGISISDFLMGSCNCNRAVNGFYQWKCVNQKCPDCSSCQPKQLKCQTNDKITIKIAQFETVTNTYVNKKGETKNSTRTERVDRQMKVSEVYNNLVEMKQEYLVHKYQIYNDRFHWPLIMAESQAIGESIFHMDYSENVAQHFKYEPQSSHFNKSQYSLHCTVQHTPDTDRPYKYIYHLSDHKKHNHAFTSSVVNHLLEQGSNDNIFRFKSDNCSTQYKCKWIFRYWSNLAREENKKVLLYYGVAGHGKGLVDAMSSFGVKAPLLNAVITGDFYYSCAQDIFDFLVILFEKDEKKNYFLLSPETIMTNEITEDPLIIKDCMKKHMICFYPNGTIQTKVNVCSCRFCFEGDFLSCATEKGKILTNDGDIPSDDEELSDYDSDADSETENEDDSDDETELYELRAESVNSIITKNSTIALYSSTNSLELFYLCKVLDFGEAKETLTDKYNHIVEKGSKFVKCQYYQKQKESRKGVQYKLLPGNVFVLPTQVLSPLVHLNSSGILSMEEYQWLCDSI